MFSFAQRAIVVGVVVAATTSGVAADPPPAREVPGGEACLALGRRVYANATRWDWTPADRDNELVDACAANPACAAGCESALAAARRRGKEGAKHCRELAHLEGPKLRDAAVRFAKRSLARSRRGCGKAGDEAYDELSCGLAAFGAVGAADAECKRTEARVATQGLRNLADARGDPTRGLVAACAELLGCAGSCGPALRGLAMMSWDQLDKASSAEASLGCRDLQSAFEATGPARTPAVDKWIRARWQRELADVCPRLGARERASIVEAARALGLSPEAACGQDGSPPR